MSERRCCLITGPTHGIGRVAAQRLAAAGYHMLLACRDVQLGEALACDLPGDSEVLYCDLSRWDTVATMCRQVVRKYPSIDLLINNAGFIDLKGTRIREFSSMMVVNHLGPFLLTNLLLDALKSTPGSRIVNVASRAHKAAKLELSDPLGQHSTATGMSAYGQSKLANVLFTLELSRRFAGTTTTCNALHPGLVGTNIMPGAGRWMRWVAPIAKHFMLSEEAGAATLLYLATADEAAALNGQYLDEKQNVTMPSVLAQDPQLQARLWEDSSNAVAAYV